MKRGEPRERERERERERKRKEWERREKIIRDGKKTCVSLFCNYYQQQLDNVIAVV